jgi:hypothetical protein
VLAVQIILRIFAVSLSFKEIRSTVELIPLLFIAVTAA